MQASCGSRATAVYRWVSQLGNLTDAIVTPHLVDFFGGGFHRPGNELLAGTGPMEKVFRVDNGLDKVIGLRRVGSRIGVDRVIGFGRTRLS